MLENRIEGKIEFGRLPYAPAAAMGFLPRRRTVE